MTTTRDASTFAAYMDRKREAAMNRRERVIAGELGPKRLVTTTRLRMEPDPDGTIGVRETQIRNHIVQTDSGPELGGFDAGPSPVELLLAAVGGCVAHTIMLQAAARRIEIFDLEVDVSATMDPRSGTPGYESTPNYPTDLLVNTRLVSTAEETTAHALVDAAERSCPVSNALRSVLSIASEVSAVQRTRD